MRSLPLAFAAVVLLAACSAPAPTTPSTRPTTGGVFAPPPDGAPSYGPGTTCAETYVLVSDNARANFSLGSENYRNEDYCAAYPYLKWLIANDPLFTGGEDRDDRNFLRMAGVYEWFATRVDSTAGDDVRRAYIDSALAVRAAGRAAMDAAGVEYDPFNRDLLEGFTYFQNAGLYEDAEARQFAAFQRAYEAKPDSLGDWYLQQLFNGSSIQYEGDRAARAAYVEALASHTADAGLRQYFTDYVTFLRTEPVTVADGTPAADTAVQALLDRARNNTICGDGALTLLATVSQQPERITALGGDLEALEAQLLQCPEFQRDVETTTDPRRLYAMAIRSYRAGNASAGNDFFNRAIANASSNAQKADFHYSRYTVRRDRSDLTAALRYNPTHGGALYTQATFVADAVGRRTDVAGRAAYWCLADRFRQVAATTTDSRVAATARSAAARYDRSGPSREQYFLAMGWRPGQTITASLGSAGSCTTRVR